MSCRKRKHQEILAVTRPKQPKTRQEWELMLIQVLIPATGLLKDLVRVVSGYFIIIPHMFDLGLSHGFTLMRARDDRYKVIKSAVLGEKAWSAQNWTGYRYTMGSYSFGEAETEVLVIVHCNNGGNWAVGIAYLNDDINAFDCFVVSKRGCKLFLEHHQSGMQKLISSNFFRRHPGGYVTHVLLRINVQTQTLDIVMNGHQIRYSVNYGVNSGSCWAHPLQQCRPFFHTDSAQVGALLSTPKQSNKTRS